MNEIAGFKQVPSNSGILLANADSQQAMKAAAQLTESGLVVRIVRGRKMKDLDALFDEFSAALQFPFYFGENWPAFNECLSELEWLVPGLGVVLVITDVENLLSADPYEMPAFARAAQNAVAAYSNPVSDGEWWDRPAIPFRFVLLTDASRQADVVATWKSAGADLQVCPSLLTDVT